MPVYAKDHEVYDEIQALKADVAKLKKASGIDQEEPKPAAEGTPGDVTETTDATSDTAAATNGDETEGEDDDDALTPRKRGRPRKAL